MSDIQSDSHGPQCRCKGCERVFVFDQAQKFDVDEDKIWKWINEQRAKNFDVDRYSIYCFAFNLKEVKTREFHERNARDGITARDVKNE